MILHYLKVAFRNLWKYRTYSLISMLCLAVRSCLHPDLSDCLCNCPSVGQTSGHHSLSGIRRTLPLGLGHRHFLRHGSAHLPGNRFQDLADYACQSGHHYQKRIKNHDTTLFKNRIAQPVEVPHAVRHQCIGTGYRVGILYIRLPLAEICGAKWHHHPHGIAHSIPPSDAGSQ